METNRYIQNQPQLDGIFSALADPTRRAILAHLASGTATVGELAEPFQISQPAISRHLKVLERAGLIERGSERQTRPAKLNAKPMQLAVAWLEDFRDHWAGRLDQLDHLLADLQSKEDQ